MKKLPWKTYAAWVLLTEAVGGLAGWLTREGTKLYTEQIVQPPLSPPAIVFPIVWVVLYALMGVSAARIWMAPPSDDRRLGLGLYAGQLAFNFFWSIFFFNLQWFGFALLWLVVLWALIAAMVLVFYRMELLAARLQLPYLVWVAFAGYLNAGVWLLNLKKDGPPRGPILFCLLTFRYRCGRAARRGSSASPRPSR